jgi:hypothetical protein
VSRARAAEPVPDLGEGAEIVAELGAAAGVALWRALRDLRLWAHTPPAARARLFADGQAARRWASLRPDGIAPDLWAPLGVVARLVESPGDADRPRLLHACRRIVAWLDERGAAETASRFRALAHEIIPPDRS